MKLSEKGIEKVENYSSVALTISKERWLELVKDVQEALECLEESKC